MVTGKPGCACSARRRIACPIPSRKKVSAFSLFPCRYGVATNSSAFRNGERGEEVGKDWTERAAQPDVEEVREVSVADVVVVRRVCGNELVRHD